MSRHAMLALIPLIALSMGPAAPRRGPPDRAPTQEVVTLPGHVEPHTPGSGAPEELPTAAPIEALIGTDPDLNRITLVRTAIDRPGPRTRAILILIPGFLSGATTFDPLARDLVERFGGKLEVWQVDRRPNQLEDRLGAIHAERGAREPDCQSSPPAPSCSIFEGARFYFDEVDFDIDLDGRLEPRLALEDERGIVRGPILMSQDDLRFFAWWGLDTYFRDWKLLVDEARRIVGRTGLVLLGGHSQGTTWSSTWAAYDFDPDPAVVDAGYTHIDGLVLLEGGGVGPGAPTKPTLADYQARVRELASGVDADPSDGVTPDVYLSSFAGINLRELATVGEVASLAAFHQPSEPALALRTPTFGSFPLGLILQQSVSTNRTIVGLFLDDDFSLNGAFRASMGFTDDGPNGFQGRGLPPFSDLPFYVAGDNGGLRTWKEFDDPTLPTCPPGDEAVSPGCAILDNGPPSDPTLPASEDPPRVNGVEREVTPMDAFVQTQFGRLNGFEWYFASGRPNLDFSYGRDSSALVAEHLATVDSAHEGPLVITQNASVDVPVIAIGGSNGLTPEPKSFDRYLDSIATPEPEREVHILEGYAHLDVINAADNEAVPLITDFVRRLLPRRPARGRR